MTRSRIATTIAMGAVFALGTTLSALPAQASAPATEGTTSLVEVLKADGVAFDRKWTDFDITEAAALAVLKDNPKSKVAVLADGNVALTAFVPEDKAFKKLARDLGAKGSEVNTEAKTFAYLADKLGIKTIESVLLYHVVPGATIAAADAVKADGTALNTALESKGKAATITVAVKGGKVTLVDADTDDADATVKVTDVNAGNKQICHGITEVLRPVNL